MPANTTAKYTDAEILSALEGRTKNEAADYLRVTKWALLRRRTRIRRQQATQLTEPVLEVEQPVVSGWVKQREVPWANPPGTVRRYILTSAQNNTHIHAPFWQNILAFAKHLGAEIMVSRFTYDVSSYGKGSVKPGKEPSKEAYGLWYDPALDLFVRDERVRLASNLLWLGEMNILPTAVRPLSGLSSYSGQDSAVVPHVKIAMESVPQMKGTEPKLIYTTGAVTQRNYIQKKEGLKAEFHHCFAFLMVEVDADGDWFVRQVIAGDDGSFQDLEIQVADGRVIGGHAVEAITWGDLHIDQMDETVAKAHWGPGGMLDTLRAPYQFLHDTLDFRSRNHHDVGNPHKMFQNYVTGQECVEAELGRAARFVDGRVVRDWCSTVFVPSNHDAALEKWLRDGDYRRDPVNARFFLRLQLAMFDAIAEDRPFHTYEEAMYLAGLDRADSTYFLATDESFILVGIEMGMHGHLGAHGARGPRGLNLLGRKANVGHRHSAGIEDGLYVSGVSGDLDMGYNQGPSAWSHSDIITYPSGKRTIVTLRGPKWRVPR